MKRDIVVDMMTILQARKPEIIVRSLAWDKNYLSSEESELILRPI